MAYYVVIPAPFSVIPAKAGIHIFFRQKILDFI